MMSEKKRKRVRDMATKCCVCGKKLGAFSRAPQLVDGRDDLPLCDKCAEMIGYAKAVDAARKSERVAKYRRDAVDFFVAKLSDGSVDAAAREALEEVAGITQEDKDRAAAETNAQEERERRYQYERSSLTMTTGYEVSGSTIERYCGIVTGTGTVGTGMVADALSSLSDLAGSVSDTMSSKMDLAKQMAIEDVRKKAIYSDADAVIGLSVDVFVLAGNMVGASATGTAVKLKVGE